MGADQTRREGQAFIRAGLQPLDLLLRGADLMERGTGVLGTNDWQCLLILFRSACRLPFLILDPRV